MTLGFVAGSANEAAVRRSGGTDHHAPEIRGNADARVGGTLSVAPPLFMDSMTASATSAARSPSSALASVDGRLSWIELTHSWSSMRYASA